MTTTMQCPCFYPDPEHYGETDDQTCACGHAVDEHDETGQCQAECIDDTSDGVMW